MTHREVSEHGRSLAEPGRFALDDGVPDQAIRHAADHRDLISALQTGRVLVAVVAVADEIEDIDGRTADKSSDMSIVSMVAADGRRGLLAFSGLDALQRWDPTARPVPVSGTDAARAALDDGCEALIVDVAGPRMQVVTEIDLLMLAGIDPLEHARGLAAALFEEAFAPATVQVLVKDEQLLVRSLDSSITARDLAAALTPRIVGLVPGGVAVQDGLAVRES
jgi:hypothetical protein